jgi:hypothetical protein
MKPCDTVITPDGEGIIVKPEFFRHAKRWAVSLNRAIPVVKCYWETEIKLKEKKR